MLELVDACLTEAVATVARRLEHALRRGLIAAELEAAGAWVATALDCAAVEDFSFEPGADPARRGEGTRLEAMAPRKRKRSARPSATGRRRGDRRAGA